MCSLINSLKMTIEQRTEENRMRFKVKEMALLPSLTRLSFRMARYNLANKLVLKVWAVS